MMFEAGLNISLGIFVGTAVGALVAAWICTSNGTHSVRVGGKRFIWQTDVYGTTKLWSPDHPEYWMQKEERLSRDWALCKENPKSFIADNPTRLKTVYGCGRRGAASVLDDFLFHKFIEPELMPEKTLLDKYSSD